MTGERPADRPGGFALRRLRSRPALGAAVALTVLLTAGVLAALNAFDASVGDAGLRRALTVQDRARATVRITAETGLADRAKAEGRVRGLTADVFGTLPATVRELARSHPYALPAGGAARPAGRPADPDLTLLASLDPDRVALRAGHLPQQASTNGARAAGPVQVAVPETAVSRLGLHTDALPSTLHLADRVDGTGLDVLVTGVYQAADATDPYWQIDPLAGRGLKVNGFTTYGPMLVGDSAFTSGALPQSGLSYLVTGDFAQARADDLDALRARVAARTSAFQDDTGYQSVTQLPAALDDLHNDLLVARSTLAIGALQLIVLATAALVLVTRLLNERQATENALLTARGAAWHRVVALTAAEAGLLALPAALLAPLLAPLVLSLLSHTGPLARAGVRLRTGLDAGNWLVSFPAAAGAVLVVVLPTALRAAGAALQRRTGSAVQRRSGRRQAVASAAARSGADLALVALAVLGYLQLSQHGSGQAGGGALSPDAQGHLGLDPVLVAAPTLPLGAGTVLALRLLPLAAKAGERLAARGRALPAALAGWQFARRPRRNSGPVLLMVLAISMGMLALGQASSLTASQHDQAAFATVGGLKVSGLGVPSLGQGGVITALPDGDRFLPVSRQELPLRGGKIGQLLAVDTRRVADTVQLRADLTGARTPAQLFGPLAAPAPTGAAAGVVLPGRPTRIDLDLAVQTVGDLRSTPPSDFPAGYDFAMPPVTAPTVRLELRDHFGVPFEVLVPAVPDDGLGRGSGHGTVSADLTALLSSPVGRAAYPLTLTGFQVSYGADPQDGLSHQLTISRIAALDTPAGPATTVALPTGLAWTVTGDPATAQSTGQQKSTQNPKVTAAAPTDQAPFGLTYVTDSNQNTAVATIGATGPGATPLPQTIDAVATQDYLAATGASVGSQVPVQIGASTLTVQITAAVPALPTVGSATGGPSAALLVDLATADRMIAATGGRAPGPP
ncbi:ABC transporter permease, partial [Kitasatospora nipponensis]|uniref:ABC transporter permease n=1 Tax=Kitasatospora nipponensis TaxID=258049 RepID=UPI0031E0F6D4